MDTALEIEIVENLYPKQKEAIFTPARIATIEASTKSGKTLGCLSWILEQAGNMGENLNHWWIAPVYPQAKIAYRRLKQGIAPFREYGFIPNESELKITLPNKSAIWFKSGEKPDNLYGEDVYSAVMDEGSRCREEAWHAVRSTLTATQGQIRIIGNVKGRKNWMYYLARKAEAGEPDMSYAKLTADDAVAAGIVQKSEIEAAKRALPEAVFKELYYAEASDDGGNPFGLKAIETCIGALSRERAECFGIDLAKSVDWTVVIGLDKKIDVCYFDRYQRDWDTTKRSITGTLDNRAALVDSTGVGDPIVEDLQKKNSFVEGFKFTQQSKQQLMEGLAVAIQQQKVKYPDGPIVNELKSFEYEYTRTGVKYTAPVGMHDDCVMALALAVKKATGVAEYVEPNIF